MNKAKRMSAAAMSAAIALVGVAALAACGGNEDIAGKYTANDGTQVTSNEVTVYMPSPTDLDDDLKAGFEAAYPGMTVNLWTGTTGEITAKLESEAANPQADVIVLASWSDGLSMKNDGQIVSYQAANCDKMGEMMVDDDYMLYGTSASAVGVIYNTKSFPDGLDADWADFGTAEFADVAMEIPDPTKSGACKDFVAGFSTGIENGDSIMQSWIDNGLKNGGGNNPAIEAVKAGEYDVLIAGVDYNAYSAIEDGESINFYYPESGTVINPRPAMIMKTAPHMDAAKLFMDYLLSEEAQELVASYYLIPGRSDVACEGRTSIDEIPTYNTDWTAMMAIASDKAQWIVDTIAGK